MPYFVLNYQGYIICIRSDSGCVNRDLPRFLQRGERLFTLNKLKRRDHIDAGRTLRQAELIGQCDCLTLGKLEAPAKFFNRWRGRSGSGEVGDGVGFSVITVLVVVVGSP